MCRMVLEWREWDHKDVEEAVQGDLMAQQALRDVGYIIFSVFIAWGPNQDYYKC